MGSGITTPSDAAAPRDGAKAARLPGTYLAVVAIDVWLLFLVLDLQMGRGIVEDIVLGSRQFFSSAFVFVPSAAVGLIPALVLSWELTARRPPPGRAGRALAGAVGWSAWAAIVALSGSSLSGPVLFQTSLFAGVALLAVSGVAFATLGLGSDSQPPGRTLIVLALGVVIFVIIGSLLMAGRWGGAA